MHFYAEGQIGTTATRVGTSFLLYRFEYIMEEKGDFPKR